MTGNTFFYSIATAITISLCVPAMPVTAQDPASDSYIEEVIVTARKREENIQDVPIAISVISGTEIEDAGLTTLSSLTRSVPNLTYIEPTSPLFAAFTIRGLSSTGNNAGIDPGVSVYVDGVHIGRGVAFDGVLMDIERVEVLKGPQGTLFGKNTAIGAISMITKKPGADRDAMIEVTAGNYDLRQVRGLLNGTLVEDKLYAKIAFNAMDRDGYLENNTGRDLNDADTWGARAQFLFDASDELEFLLTVESSRDDLTGNYLVNTPNEPLSGSDFSRKVSIPRQTLGKTERDMWATSLQIDYDFGNFALTSISSYRTFDSFFEADQDYSPLNALVTSRREDQDQFSQEIRIASTGEGPFSWVAGVYYFDQDVDSTSVAGVGPDFLFAALGIPLVGSGLCPSVLGDIGPPFGVLPCDLFIAVDADITSTTTAAFASGTYDFTDAWSLTAGLRFTREKKELDFTQTTDQALLATVFGFPPIAPFDESFSDSEVSGDISLLYKLSEEVSTYAKYSRGFKAGGYNATLASGVSLISFEPEFIDSYELGLKSTLLDNRLHVNVAVFYMDFDDKQEQQFVPGAGFRQTNAGRAMSQGFEIEVTARPAPRWHVSAGLGYTDAEYDEFLTGDLDMNGMPVDLGDNDLVGAPDITANFSTQYRFPLFDWAELSLRGEVNYQDTTFNDQENTSDLETDSFTLVNARIGLHSPTDSWSVTLWGNNLFEDEALNLAQIQNIPVPGRLFVPLNPRTYGVELRVHF